LPLFWFLKQIFSEIFVRHGRSHGASIVVLGSNEQLI